MLDTDDNNCWFLNSMDSGAVSTIISTGAQYHLKRYSVNGYKKILKKKNYFGKADVRQKVIHTIFGINITFVIRKYCKRTRKLQNKCACFTHF